MSLGRKTRSVTCLGLLQEANVATLTRGSGGNERDRAQGEMVRYGTALATRTAHRLIGTKDSGDGGGGAGVRSTIDPDVPRPRASRSPYAQKVARKDLGLVRLTY